MTARHILAVAAVLVLPGCFVVSVEKDAYEDARSVAVPRDHLHSVREVSSAQEVPHFRHANAAKLSRLGPGSSVADLRREFPGAIFVERRLSTGTPVDCYRVDHTERYRYKGDRHAYEVSDEAYFFFADEKLVKWGMTKAWPD